MGFFMNLKKHPDVYTKEPKNTKNQSYARVNFLSNLLNNQQLTNKNVQATLNQIHTMQKKHQLQQATQWAGMQKQYRDLQKMIRDKDKEMKTILHHMEQLQNQANDQSSRWDQIESKQGKLLQQLDKVEEMNDLIMQRLTAYEEQHRELLQRLAEMEALQNETTKQITGQTERQREIVNQLATQEALLDKVMRQVEHIREIIFERSHYLSTKFEQGWHHVIHFFTKPNQTSSYLLEKKEIKKE